MIERLRGWRVVALLGLMLPGCATLGTGIQPPATGTGATGTSSGSPNSPWRLGGRAADWHDRVDPLLWHLRRPIRLSTVPKTTRGPIRLLVTYRDHVPMPLFPSLIDSLPITDARNDSILGDIRSLIDGLIAARAPYYANAQSRLAAQDSVVGVYWITQTLAIDSDSIRVADFIADTGVTYVEAAYADTLQDPHSKPPTCSGSVFPVSDARDRLVSDPVYSQLIDLGLKGKPIGLLDTGVMTGHSLFGSGVLGTLTATECFKCHVKPDGSASIADCATDASGDVWSADYGHGTESAGILIGGTALGDPYRGVVPANTDMVRVYDSKGLDREATLCGIEYSRQRGDKVILSQTQMSGSTWESVTQAANKAFETGALVLGAAGDYGSLVCPSNGRNVLGVGAVSVCSGAPYPQQGTGTASGCVKPDFQGPTDTQTAGVASSGSSTAVQSLGGTSGSTPYAGALASLLWAQAEKRHAGAAVLPGEVCALMVLCGQNVTLNQSLFGTAPNRGAGTLIVPQPGTIQSEALTITPSATVKWIDTKLLPVAFTGQVIDAALWWPGDPAAGAAQPDLDVSLWHKDTKGNLSSVLSSIHTSGSMERLRYTVGDPTGSWFLRITWRLPSSMTSVRAYWAASTHM